MKSFRPSPLGSAANFPSTVPTAMLRWALPGAVAWLALLLLGGCAMFRPDPAASRFVPTVFTPATSVAEQSPLDPALLLRPTCPFTLGPGDQLDIELIGDRTTRTSVEVGPDGKIYFYLLPGLDVWGLTLAQTRALILEQSKTYLKKDQSVVITLRSIASQRVWLIGRFNNPGLYPLSGPMTLLEAIAQAGGPANTATGSSPDTAGSANADLSHSFVLRQGQMLPVDFRRLLQEGDLSQNIYLQPDDFVYLPPTTTQTVHVLGAVTSPRAISFNGQSTLVQSIASAGGTLPYAHLENVAILRGSLTDPQIAMVDYQAILRGTAPDVILAPRDIVFVPDSPDRGIKRYANLILETFVRTIGVYEGSRAVSQTNVPLQVNVPITP